MGSTVNADTMVLLQFGSGVRARRLEKRWTQLELAKRAGIGWETLSRIEHGRANTSIYVATRLAAALGTSVSALLGDEVRDLRPRDVLLAVQAFVAQKLEDVS